MNAIELIPVLSESGYASSKEKNVYLFKAPVKSSRQAIAKAIEKQFSVSVVKVNTSITGGKVKRTMSLTGKRYSNQYGSQKDFKKAYITLKKGDKLPIYEGIEEAEKKKEESQAKFDKALAANEKKEAKKVAKSAPTKRRFLLGKRPEGN